MKNSNSWLVGLFVALVMIGGVGARVAAALPLINGDFNSGLTGWEYASATLDSSAAKLSDTESGAFLYQGVVAGPGTYKLDFDVKFALADSAPGSLPDSFFATIYFDEAFNLSSFENLFSCDVNGFYEVNAAGSIIDNPIQGWRHFSLVFTNLGSLIIPTFELYDLNQQSNESFAWIDKVSISEQSTPVPEPSTMMLLAGGGMLLLATRVRRRN